MTHQLLEIVTRYGLVAVAVNIFLDQLGLPVPAIPILVVAGAAAAQGALPWGPLLGVAVLACLLPDCLWFQIGQSYGMRVLKTLCRISLEPDSCVSTTQSRFERWGINSIVIAKFVPGLAVIAPPLAGAMRIGWPRFVALSSVGALLWAGSGLVAGALFRTQVGELLGFLDHTGSVAVLILAALLGAYLLYKAWERARFHRLLRMARIGVEDLYELIQAGAEPIIVDVRSSSARELEPRYIPGAIHVPLNDVATRLTGLPRDREVILYCTCPSEASAARVARILMNHGFNRVRPLRGGLDAWVAAGYEVEGLSAPGAGAVVAVPGATPVGGDQPAVTP